MMANPASTSIPEVESNASVTVHTIGYQQRTLDELILQLKEAGINVLVDVRETAWSNRRDFAKFRLAPALEAEGMEYIHAKFAGNPKELRRGATSHADCLRAYADYLNAHPGIVEELRDVVDRHQAAGRRVSLFCYERHPDDCHRSILATALGRILPHGMHVLHLGPEGAPRLAH